MQKKQKTNLESEDYEKNNFIEMQLLHNEELNKSLQKLIEEINKKKEEEFKNAKIKNLLTN